MIAKSVKSTDFHADFNGFLWFPGQNLWISWILVVFKVRNWILIKTVKFGLKTSETDNYFSVQSEDPRGKHQFFPEKPQNLEICMEILWFSRSKSTDFVDFSGFCGFCLENRISLSTFKRTSN